MRTVLTLERMREFDGLQHSVAKRLAEMHLDYIMLMCLHCAEKDLWAEVDHRFPDYRAQFQALAGSLGKVEQE